MRLTGVRGAICASVVALAAASSASASWPGYYGWGGWRGAYSPYYGWSGYHGYSPWYRSNYYPSYYSYYPSYYSYYPSYTAYAPAYAVPQAVVTAPSGSTSRSFYPPSGLASTPPANEATVVVRTAPAAELWFNGVETTQTGAVRTFATPELRPGESYSYEIKVRWVEDGKYIERTRKVVVAPGQKVEVDLTPANLRNG
jgi:uncharacterized protein (TIGR03000 family)